MDTVDPLRVIFAFTLVLGLLGLLAFGLKRFGASQLMLGNKKQEGRLRVLEVRYIDPRRKLVLVARDRRQHLLLLADGRETVVESFNAEEPSHAA